MAVASHGQGLAAPLGFVFASSDFDDQGVGCH
jgi:hypothetical protein